MTDAHFRQTNAQAISPSLLFVAHATYWLSLILFAVLLFAMATSRRIDTINLSALLFASPIFSVVLLPSVASFYIAYFAAFRRWAARVTVAGLALRAFAISLFAGVATLAALGVAFGWHAPMFSRVSEAAAVLGIVVVIAFAHAMLGIIARGYLSWYDERQRSAQLAALAEESELALIRSKIEPHFLFNSLNNIDVLIAKAPQQASAYLQGMSELLRFALYDAHAKAISLDKEVAYLGKYLDIERLRSREPKRISFEVFGSASDLTIAPMMLTPFVENAIKHSEGIHDEGAIQIRIDIVGDKVTLQCCNRISTRRETTPADGLGLRLVERRLQLIYPNRHRLEINEANGIYEVTLTIDLKKHALHHR
jgi:two-component system, LytTR family, sensor kinase